MSSVSLVAIFRLVLVAIGILFGSHNEAAAYLKLENLGSECYEASVQERTSWYDGDVNKLFERGTRRAWRNAVTGREDLAEVRIALDRLQPNATRGAGAGANVVYRSVNAAGKVDYVGITNNLARRAAEHLNTKGIQIEVSDARRHGCATYVTAHRLRPVNWVA